MNAMPASSVYVYRSIYLVFESLSEPIVINHLRHSLSLFAMLLIFCLYLRFLDQRWLFDGIVQLLNCLETGIAPGFGAQHQGTISAPLFTDSCDWSPPHLLPHPANNPIRSRYVGYKVPHWSILVHIIILLAGLRAENAGTELYKAVVKSIAVVNHQFSVRFFVKLPQSFKAQISLIKWFNGVAKRKTHTLFYLHVNKAAKLKTRGSWEVLLPPGPPGQCCVLDEMGRHNARFLCIIWASI